MQAFDVNDWMGDILSRAADVSADALAKIALLLDEAQSIADQTDQVRSELDQFLGQFALESGLTDGTTGPIRFAGGLIDIESMRADVARMALNADKASKLVTSLQSIHSSLDAASHYFIEESPLTTTLDARQEGMQAAMIAAREDERRKLAREIHDGPAQVLVNAHYHVQIIEQIVKRNPTALDEELMRLKELLLEGNTEVRRFMFDLRPTTLEDYGLGPTLQRSIDDWGRFFGHKVNASLDSSMPRLSAEQELAVYRIVMQSLQNIHQHAGNDCSVEITIHLDRTDLVVRVSDNGVGFDPALVSPKLTSGAGLMGMRERAAAIHATFNVESSPGAGSTITLIVPSVGGTGSLSGRGD